MARDKITMHREAVDITSCSVMRALLILGGKWKMLVMYLLAYESKNGVLRYSDFQNLIPSISARVLTQQLRELEADGLIGRQVYQVIPPKVEYSLTEIGKLTIPFLSALHTFGGQYKELYLNAEEYRRVSVESPKYPVRTEA